MSCCDLKKVSEEAYDKLAEIIDRDGIEEWHRRIWYNCVWFEHRSGFKVKRTRVGITGAEWTAIHLKGCLLRLPGKKVDKIFDRLEALHSCRVDMVECKAIKSVLKTIDEVGQINFIEVPIPTPRWWEFWK